MSLSKRQIRNRLYQAADLIEQHGRAQRLMLSNGSCCTAGALARVCGAPESELLNQPWFREYLWLKEAPKPPRWFQEASEVMVFIEAHLVAMADLGYCDLNYRNERVPFRSVTSFSDNTRKPALVTALRQLGDLAVA